MALFRRARGKCPACGREKSADVAERGPDGKVDKRKTWTGTCTCGEALTLTIKSDWWYSFRDAGGRQRRRKHGPDRASARRVLAKIRTELAEGRYIDRKPSCKTSLGSLLGEYTKIKIASRDKGPRACSRLESIARVLIRGLGESTRIDRLDENTIEAYRAKRLESVKTGTTSRELSYLSGALSWAIKRGLLTSKPKISTPRSDTSRTRFLDRAEADRLVEACDEDQHATWIGDLVRAALATGCRRGELLALRWDWLDRASTMITLPGDSCKSGKGRHVPINPALAAVLKRRRMVQSGPLVFHVKGKRIHDNTASDAFARAVRRADLWRHKGHPDKLTFHGLRHTAASWLVMAGIDLHTVATILGHSSLEITKKYAHLAPGHLRAAMDTISMVEAEPDPDPRPVEDDASNVIPFVKVN